MVNDDRYIYVWDKSCHDYAGAQIDAYWTTPLTDVGAKAVTKAFKWLYFRGTGGIIKVTYNIGKFGITNAYQMPANDAEILRVPLLNEGKTFSVKLYNESGSWFKLLGGAEIEYEIKRD